MTGPRKQIRHSVAFAVLTACFATSCGAQRTGPLISHAKQGVVWPPGSGRARIAYVGQVRGAVSSNKVVNLIAGEARPTNLVRPAALTVTPQGVLAVADAGGAAVHLFYLGRRRHTVVRSFKGRSLRMPVGIAADRRGRIYVADARLRTVFVFDSDGRPVTSYSGWKRPSGLAVDRARARLYIADTAAHRIHVRDIGSKPRYLFGFGQRGAKPGEFNFPTYLCFSAATRELLVTDTLNYRIQRLSAEGKPLGMFGRIGDSTGGMARPKGVAVDSDGHIYVVDTLFNAVQIFDQAGQLLLSFGKGGRGLGQLSMPSGVFVDSRDRIFVANSLNRRIEIYRYLR